MTYMMINFYIYIKIMFKMYTFYTDFVSILANAKCDTLYFLIRDQCLDFSYIYYGYFA